MSEHSATGNGQGGARLAAHERMSTGALARWARACATHPWRVLGSWLGIIVVLIALVATVGGGLRDEFSIPGSDTQRATDLIEAEFASEQGAVLNIVFAAPEGQRLDTPARKAAIEQAMTKLRGAVRVKAPTDGEPALDERRRPVQRADVLEERAHRVLRGAVRPDDRGQGPRRRRGRRGRRAGGRRARRRDGRVQRRGGVPADQAGDVRAARPARGADRAAHRLPHVRRGVRADHAGDRRARDRVPAPLHPGRADRHQHGHADPRLDDRTGRRDRLLAVHRHPFPPVPPRGARAEGRGRRGRRVGRARGAVRRADRCDLGDRARLLRPRLRHEARDRQRARRPHHGAARELVPPRGAGAARSQDRPAEGAVPAPRSTTRRRRARRRCSRGGAGS